MSLTIDQQIEAMTAIWPSFKLVRRVGRTALWRGTVRPLLQTYVVDILYRAPLALEHVPIRWLQPQVEVMRPALRPRRGDPEGMLPHVYYDDANGSVYLCLLDPDAREWSASDLLAETTVPWTIDWLAAYEGWRATGTWTAPGRHVEA